MTEELNTMTPNEATAEPMAEPTPAAEPMIEPAPMAEPTPAVEPEQPAAV